VAKWKITILDTEQDSRNLLLDLFHDSAFKAVTATARASKTLAQSDLILLNLRTPDMDFHTAFRKLQDRAKDTPILVLASYDSVERSARDLSRPIDFVTYPTDPSELELLAVTVLGAAGRLNDDTALLGKTLNGLARAIDARDAYMNGHFAQVQAWCDRAADCLSLPKSDRKTLHWFALLHDVSCVANEKALFRLVAENHGLPAGGELSEWYDEIRQVVVKLPHLDVRFGHFSEVYLVTVSDHRVDKHRTLFELIAAIDLLDVQVRGSDYVPPRTLSDALKTLEQKGVFDPKILRVLAEVSPSIHLNPIHGGEPYGGKQE
jgi:CheY-like chemotaxis protein